MGQIHIEKPLILFSAKTVEHCLNPTFSAEEIDATTTIVTNLP